MCFVKNVYHACFPFYGNFNRLADAGIRTEENIAVVSGSVHDDNKYSIRGHLLLNNVDGFRSKTFQNKGSMFDEANFWLNW